MCQLPPHVPPEPSRRILAHPGRSPGGDTEVRTARRSLGRLLTGLVVHLRPFEDVIRILPSGCCPVEQVGDQLDCRLLQADPPSAPLRDTPPADFLIALQGA